MESQKEKIVRIDTKLDAVYKEVMGNGNDGLSKATIRLQDSVIQLNETVKSLRTAVSGFDKFQASIETIIRQDEKNKVQKRWYITTVIAFGSIILTAGLTIIGYLFFKK